MCIGRIPIFSSQLEKAREATDMANIRAAYAAVSTDVLTDPQKEDTQNDIKYNSGIYTTTVTATQKQTKWQTNSSDKQDETSIGGQKVTAATLKGWTITGNVEAGTVTIAEKTAD